MHSHTHTQTHTHTHTEILEKSVSYVHFFKDKSPSDQAALEARFSFRCQYHLASYEIRSYLWKPKFTLPATLPEPEKSCHTITPYSFEIHFKYLVPCPLKFEYNNLSNNVQYMMENHQKWISCKQMKYGFEDWKKERNWQHTLTLPICEQEATTLFVMIKSLFSVAMSIISWC
jgi:hypothetical protein